MALHINNLAQLKKFSKNLVPSECLADAKSAKAELHMYQDSESLPRLHLSWRESHFVSLKTEDEVAEAKALGYTVEKDCANGEDPRWHTYAQETQESHLWFCNFRRYGWSFTDDTKGEYGYGAGVTYANGPAIYHIATTPEETVRDAMVHTWAEAVGNRMVPQFLDQPEVHALLDQMLQDAIQNISRYATPRRAPAGFGYVKVSVLTENPNVKARAREQLKKQQAELAKEAQRISEELERLD
jgi:hypothetical protein